MKSNWNVFIGVCVGAVLGFAVGQHMGAKGPMGTPIKGAQASPITDEKFAAMANTKGDQLVFIQGAEPISLYCADESDGETFRVCGQITEGLYGYEINGTNPIPKLATECAPSTDLLTWTCKIRPGVKFHDGSPLTARDVQFSWEVASDPATSPEAAHRSRARRGSARATAASLRPRR